jgi:hypothetical protein
MLHQTGGCKVLQPGFRSGNVPKNAEFLLWSGARLWFDEPVSNPSGLSLSRRLNEKLYRLALVFAGACLALSCFRPMMDNVDLGWHVAQGRWMVEHGAVYRHDVLNYPTLGQPLVNEYPLFQVVLFLVWKLGWWGPCVFTALAYAAMAAVLARAARNCRLDGSGLVPLALATTILFLQLAFPLRPHLATYLGVTVLGTFLLRHRHARTWTEFWPMALLQIAWTNSHSGFVLGPAMVALFGGEMTVRESIRLRTISWTAARTWGGAFLLILLACFVNPFGFARFYPPFYQDQLEAIRAYVGEMQPLQAPAAGLYQGIFLVSAAAIAGAVLLCRGAACYSYLLLAALFYDEALSVQKSWPVFGLFVPLAVLGSGAFALDAAGRKTASWADVPLNFLVTAFFGMTLLMRLGTGSPASLRTLWREYDLGRREISYEAVFWMKEHGVAGRLLHRCEDGGWLQEAGYDHGETFGDTGFGKYDEAFIHTVALLGERPAVVPRYLEKYRPAFTVCNNFSYLWPHYLRQAGWRLIFYSPYSSVWTSSGNRPDLPTVTDDAVKAAFVNDLAANGRPLDPLLLGRNLIELNSLGLEDFAFAQLTALPRELHDQPWYWEAARILCVETPRFSTDHRHRLLAEADGLHDDGLTAEFRAWAHEIDGDAAAARAILEAVPRAQLGSHATDLLLKIDLEQNRPGTLELAERRGGFDLRDGFHWEYVAEAESQAGHEAEAARAWEKAVFYYPDEPSLMGKAADFAGRFHDAELARAVQAATWLEAPADN